MSEEQQESTEEKTEEKSGWVGKILTWGIVAVIGIGIVKMQDSKKNDWFEQQHQKSVAWCSGDSTCTSSVEKHWKECVEDNYESTRSGKYNRKYSIDDSALRLCLLATGANTLASLKLDK